MFTREDVKHMKSFGGDDDSEDLSAVLQKEPPCKTQNHTLLRNFFAKLGDRHGSNGASPDLSFAVMAGTNHCVSRWAGTVWVNHLETHPPRQYIASSILRFLA
jgi:hypothetical protein